MSGSELASLPSRVTSADTLLDNEHAPPASPAAAAPSSSLSSSSSTKKKPKKKKHKKKHKKKAKDARRDVERSIAARSSRRRGSGQLSHYLLEEEKQLMRDIMREVGRFQRRRVGWLGNFVARIRRAVGNPKDERLRLFTVPIADEILRQAAETRVKEGFRVADEEEIMQRASRDFEAVEEEEMVKFPVTLDEALDGALRFMLVNELDKAKHLLTISLSYYPTDLRLYKMYAFVVLHDRTLNWRDVRLQELLNLLDHAPEPDAEILALKGDTAQAIWRLDKVRLQTAELALTFYDSCYRRVSTQLRAMSHVSEMVGTERRVSDASDETAAAAAAEREEAYVPETHSVGVPLARSALLCSELFAILSRSGRRRVASATVYRAKAESNLERLITMLQDWAALDKSIQEDRYYHYNLLFAHLGLGQYNEAEKAALGYQQHLRTEMAYDDLAEDTTRYDMENLIHVIIFGGLDVPESDDVSKWARPWQLMRETFSLGSRHVNVTRDILSSIARGRVGIALSGGGLRALFLHLGMLARLADCDVLRHIEAVSCTSGGSLAGSLFYLLVKQLAESKPDGKITKQDYIELVQRMIDIFSSGTKADLYARTLLNPLDNLRVAFSSDTVRLHLLARQFHEHIFCQAGTGDVCEVIKMREMATIPIDWQRETPFNPRQHNWRRSTKVPALYLNCTNLNTGHLWRFCVTYMGEKADMTGGDLGVDTNAILESMPYEQAVDPRHRNIPLVECIGVSMAVPGVVTAPYSLDGLYQGINVRLVDGGIFDNAGLVSLYHALTDVVLHSDMTATLEDQTQDASTGTVSTLFRVLEISLDLSYERMFRELRSKAQSHGVKDVCFVFLRQYGAEMTAEQREAIHYQRRVPPIKQESQVEKEGMGIAFRYKAIERAVAHSVQKRRLNKRKQRNTLRHWESMRYFGSNSSSSLKDVKDKPHVKMLLSRADSEHGPVAPGHVEDEEYESEEEESGADVPSAAPRMGSGQSKSQSQSRFFGDDVIPDLTVFDLILANSGKVRSSLDAYTDVERESLITLGYMLTEQSLQRSSATSAFGGFSTDDALHLTVARGASDEYQINSPLNSRSKPADLLREFVHGNDGDDDGQGGDDDTRGDRTSSRGSGIVIPPSRQPSALLSADPSKWQYFDVKAERSESWSFNPTFEIVQSTKSIPVKHDRLEDRHGVVLHDRHRRAGELRQTLNIRSVTDNPAVVSLYEQTKRAESPISAFRAFSLSKTTATLACLFILAIVAAIGWVVVGGFIELLQDSDRGYTFKECWCVLEEPLFYFVLFAVLTVLFVNPGYLRRILWAVLFGPLYSLISIYVFDPMLVRAGRQQDLVSLHERYMLKKQKKQEKQKRG